MTDANVEPQPPTKRRRHLLDSEAMDLDKGQYWFEDGDIVLAVEDKHLKLHRNKLMTSSLVFSTMLELPQPAVEESYGGCPLVQVHDKLHDWVPALDWMYDRSAFEKKSTSMDVMARALRISTKYDIMEMHQWCRQQLLARWPLNVAEMDTRAMANAAEAILLARESDLPEILPAAFYALAVQRWGNASDGDHSYLILSPDDLRRLIVGRELLLERLMALLVNWDPRLSAKFFHVCRTCEPTCSIWLSEMLMPSPHSPYTTWLLHDLKKLSKEGFTGLIVCTDCDSMFGEGIEQFIANFQYNIPKYFML